jgi:predicted esterase
LRLCRFAEGAEVPAEIRKEDAVARVIRPRRLLICFLAIAGAASAQSIVTVKAAADRYHAQKQGLPLTGDQRKLADLLEREARRATQNGRFGDALRAYAHATAVVRNVEWTPALDLATSLALRTDHFLPDPGQSVILSLAPLYPTTQSEDVKLTATVFLVPSGKANGRQLVPPVTLNPLHLPFAIRFPVPDVPPGNYSLEVRLSPSDSEAPEILHDILLKSLTVHIESLSRSASALAERLAHVSSRQAPETTQAPKTQAALATAEYVLRFYERADRGEEGLRRFSRYPFGEQFAAANAILDDLAAGRDPFGVKHGDFRRAYRSAVDRTLQPYRLFVPTSYDGQHDSPLVVALHGSGGDENDFFDSYPEAPLKPEAERLGFLVVCPKGRGPTSGYRGPAERDVFDVLAEVRRDYRIDPRRIYLMGHSMGAYATWRLAAQHTGIFAALGPIAGGGNPADMEKLRNVPQYVVHGAMDETVSVMQSRAMVAAARRAGAEVVYVELPTAGHYDAVIGQFAPMLEFFAAHPQPASPGRSSDAGTGRRAP